MDILPKIKKYYIDGVIIRGSGISMTKPIYRAQLVYCFTDKKLIRDRKGVIKGKLNESQLIAGAVEGKWVKCTSYHIEA